MWAIKQRSRKGSGFTIVELLIVIVVIAILAAIVIVAYNSVQARASFSKEQQDLKSITKALGLYHIDHEAYPNTTGQSGCTYKLVRLGPSNRRCVHYWTVAAIHRQDSPDAHD